MKTLYALPYSPWSEKARWALDHHRIHYRETAYKPPLDEIYLRVRTKNLTGRISVPLLLDGSRALTDSWDIARYADDLGAREKLVPTSLFDEIRAIDQLSQRGLDAGRVLVIRQASRTMRLSWRWRRSSYARRWAP
jgi:glutathione S-transferase